MNAQDFSWGAIVPSIITGLAAFLGVMLTNRASYNKLKLENEIQNGKRQVELLRDRGEELYVLCEKWANGIFHMANAVLPVMEGRYSFNDYLDMIINKKQNPNDEFARIEMMVDVYFPTIRPAYDELCACRKDINDTISTYKQQYKSGITDGHSYIPKIHMAQVRLTRAAEVLKNSIKACLQLGPGVSKTCS